MDDSLSKATSKRIGALFSRQTVAEAASSNARDFSTKNRSKELKRLATSMSVTVGDLKEMLRTQRPKMNDGDEKSAYVDWILTKEDRKRPRKDSQEVNEEKKTDDLPQAPASAPASTSASSAKPSA